MFARTSKSELGDGGVGPDAREDRGADDGSSNQAVTWGIRDDDL